ncbi:TRIC cation channel family protein [Solirubrobacter ginsenosidimutans]|uniref:TRIC cation channel family protein n=1 Tax=Solirubrobacter ginsenosidimutans TaxID=490573 RepID=A0A9X3MY14_9ACTN|nr:TRIC cation channel family protein [Solirubrobacter ginsenosidimutans]MDA0161498.1 TRIC cation channel family protein [Solirubrobacter ginsenosidimutans]
MDALDAFRSLDLLGVAAGAASGALAARRQDSFDLVGVLGLAFACGLGGGLLRDLLLNANTPVALTDALYLPTVITAAIVVSVIAGEPGPKILRSIRILDSLAVGFFAVASTQRARQVGVTVPAQLLIGVLGGSGGALLRDILTARTPEIFRHGELNALAALAAAIVFVLADLLTPTTSAMFIGLLVGFALRAAAIHFNLRGPAPRTSRRGDP